MSDALSVFDGPEAEEIAIFIDMFDKWFDTMNVCNFTDGQYQCKSFKKPYSSSDTGEEDFRLKVRILSTHAKYKYLNNYAYLLYS